MQMAQDVNGSLLFASSTDRRNTCNKSFRRCLVFQGLSRPLILPTRHGVQLCLRVYRQISALGGILPQQAVCILIGAALPRAARVTEVDFDVGCQGKALMISHLLAPVPGQ
jgi:hypothetical protein